MLTPFKETALLRATEADPNEGRCVVENCPKERGVQAMHILPRVYTRSERLVWQFRSTSPRQRYSYSSSQMDSFEYSWNLRRGTLNLDTRENVLFGERAACGYSSQPHAENAFVVGKSLASMYTSGCWSLLPEDAILDKFYYPSTQLAIRGTAFPVLVSFCYALFLPLTLISQY